MTALCNGCGFPALPAVSGLDRVDHARAHRDAHLAAHPDLDAISRHNLDLFVEWTQPTSLAALPQLAAATTGLACSPAGGAGHPSTTKEHTHDHA